MKKIFLFVMVCIMVSSFFGCAKTTQINMIFNASEYSKISSDELIQKMGECSEKEDWVFNDKYNFTTYYYDSNGIHYEFVVCDDNVIRVSVYSQSYWTGEGEKFRYNNKNKKDILDMFGVEYTDDARATADTGFAWKVKPGTDTVAEINVQDINSEEKTFGFVKITYDSKYFK